MKNYYDILGINFDASQEEIKKAFREMAMKYHPDKHQDEENIEYYEAMFKDINEAYEVLRDAEKRRQYDLDYSLYEADQRRRENERRERDQRRRQSQTTSGSSTRTRTNTRSKQKDDTSFFDDFKKAYQEVKRDEKQEPFFKRHSRYNKEYWRRCGQFTDTKAGNVLFRMSQGVVHVSGELLHQLSKIKYIGKDNVVKFTIRNRATALAIVGIILASNLPGWISGDTNTNNPTTETVSGKGTEEETDPIIIDEPEEEEETITLTRIYTVQVGDSLSSLSDMSLSTMNTIRSINDIDSNNMIYIGQEIKLPYEIEKEDLQYYIEQVDTEGLSVSDLAEQYETDVDTLVQLNEEAIGTAGGTKVFITNKVYVPKFITHEELDELKANDKKEKTR